MPITAIDPRSALVVIDMQKGIVAMPTVHPAQAVSDNVIRLAGTCRGKGLPVVLVRVGWSADFGDVVKTRIQAQLRQQTHLPTDRSIALLAALRHILHRRCNLKMCIRQKSERPLAFGKSVLSDYHTSAGSRQIWQCLVGGSRRRGGLCQQQHTLVTTAVTPPV
jgi:nicotinamidase-related amidase